jgi:hypothetical protein
MKCRVCSVLGICLALFLAGCHGDDNSSPSNQAISLQNQVHPDSVSGLVPSAKLTPDPASDVGPDPLTSGGDPVAAPSSIGGDPLADNDPILRDSGAAATTEKPRLIKNWYWLKGSIANGTVDVKVNSVDIGRFAVHVDKEISDFVNPGSNQVQFTTTPTSLDEPVTCDLNVTYSQEAVGALPVLTFNNTIAPSTANPTSPSTSLADNYVPPSPDSTSSTAQPDPMDPSAGSTTQTLEFNAQ